MSHERYPLEERTRIPFYNEEWHRYAGKEYRYPSQAGEALVVEGVNCLPEHAQQLETEGVIFPMETGQPMPAEGLPQQDQG
jgi:hypothetical protein